MSRKTYVKDLNFLRAKQTAYKKKYRAKRLENNFLNRLSYERINRANTEVNSSNNYVNQESAYSNKNASTSLPNDLTESIEPISVNQLNDLNQEFDPNLIENQIPFHFYENLLDYQQEPVEFTDINEDSNDIDETININEQIILHDHTEISIHEFNLSFLAINLKHRLLDAVSNDILDLICTILPKNNK
jgi:hypothetical protein